jgi:uncharacterized DUF497 family protein
MDQGVIEWNQVKNEWLKANRNLSFEDVVAALAESRVIEDVAHPTKPHQRVLVVLVRDYVCAVPYVRSEHGIFLKTIYQDRRLNEKYGVAHD